MQINPKHLARNTDPATSKEAAQAGEKSGVFGGQRLSILEVLQSLGEMHASAIADEVGLHTHQVLKRLSDLQRMGFAVPTDKRVGRQRVWRALENEK